MVEVGVKDLHLKILISVSLLVTSFILIGNKYDFWILLPLAIGSSNIFIEDLRLRIIRNDNLIFIICVTTFINIIYAWLNSNLRILYSPIFYGALSIILFFISFPLFSKIIGAGDLKLLSTIIYTFGNMNLYIPLVIFGLASIIFSITSGIFLLLMRLQMIAR